MTLKTSVGDFVLIAETICLLKNCFHEQRRNNNKQHQVIKHKAANRTYTLKCLLFINSCQCSIKGNNKSLLKNTVLLLLLLHLGNEVG